MNILFTSAGRRNYLLKYFKDALDETSSIIAADMQVTAPALAAADKAYIVPPISSPDYINNILNICEEEEIKGIFSLNDLELPVLVKAKKEFEGKGIKLVVSDESVIQICFDKWETVKFCESNKLSSPLTLLKLEEAIECVKLGKLKFPAVIKPRWGSASIGIEFVYSLEELELAYKLLKKKLLRTILADAGKDSEDVLIIQEKIEGTEFGLDILNDFNGVTRQVYVKEKLAMRAGETDKAVLRNKPDLEELGFKLGISLKHIGNLDCDIFESEGKYYLLEMNPRFGGGYPFSHMAGANYPAALIAWLKNEEYDFSRFTRLYDQPFSKCDTIIPVRKN